MDAKLTCNGIHRDWKKAPFLFSAPIVSSVYPRIFFFSTRQLGHRGVPHPGQSTDETFIPETGQQQQAHTHTVRFFFGAYGSC